MTVEIRPMEESWVIPHCLHAGPIDTTSSQDPASADSRLPPHPWSDATIRDLAGGDPDFDLCSAGRAFPTEFMREMIDRHGTCALLAWQEQSVVGFARFYPMRISRLLGERRAGEIEPILDPTLACEPEEDEGTLWVHCVMTSRPYTGGSEQPGLTSGADDVFRTAREAGARKGVGLKLAQALVSWARAEGWRRIIKIAPCDLDFFYGIWGGGGRRFWEKAGFNIAGSIYRPQQWSESDMNTLRAQITEAGMSEEQAFTFHRMACEL